LQAVDILDNRIDFRHQVFVRLRFNCYNFHIDTLLMKFSAKVGSENISFCQVDITFFDLLSKVPDIVRIIFILVALVCYSNPESGKTGQKTRENAPKNQDFRGISAHKFDK